MKKTLLAFAFVASAALVSCQGQIEPSSQKEGNDGTKLFTASINNAITRTTLGYSSGETVTYPVNWTKDDRISINGKDYKATTGGSATSSFTAVDGDATENSSSPFYEAYYPSSIYNGGTPTLPSTVAYDAEASYLPMYAATTNKGSTSLSFKNICAVLAVTVKNADFPTVKTIRVSSSNMALSGAFTVSDGAAVLTAASTVANTVTLNCATAVTTATDGTVFYIAIPAQSYQNLKIEISADGTSYTKTMTTKKVDGIEVAVNTVYPITFKADASVLLPGLFTVSAGTDGTAGTSDDVKVQFTKGNLWCNTTTNPVEWHLESAQNVTYKTLGQSSYNASHVCLFYWSKTASVAYANNYSDEGRAADDKFFCGEDNKLTVDGQSGLYALSCAEWSYLIENRTNASSLYKHSVSVTTSAGTVSNCVVIAPDDWDYKNSPLKESYTVAEWITAESSGLVCLPAAGNRAPTFGHADDYGSFWSSTPIDPGCAYRLYCYGIYVYAGEGDRDFGLSVRLVCSVSE